MRLGRTTLIGVLIATGLAATSTAQQITDPYEILNRSFEARGGLDRLKAEQSSYLEGAVTLGQMEGTVKAWTRWPGQSRIEVSLPPLSMIQGDNGEFSWVVDQNGKLQKMTNPDEATANRRKVRRLLNEYAYADPNSDVFVVSFENVENVVDKDCYVIKAANNINLDAYIAYINTETFVLEKAVYYEDVESRDVFYGDYRDVEGLQVAFRTRELHHRSGMSQQMIVTEYVSNPELDPALFEPPAEGTRDYEFVTGGDRSENIPVRFIGNHLFIPVVVGGKERLWVLDTGAAMTVLNRDYAEELGLVLEGAVTGQGGGGRVEAAFTRLPPFRLGDIQFREQTVAVINMNELIRRIGLDVVGILGYDFLSRFVTRVDFANELVSFYDPETFEYTGDGHELRIHVERSSFEVPVVLDGVHSGSWLVDLGAGTTHLDGVYARREGYADRDGVIGVGHGAGNEYRLKEIRCDSMAFAGYTVYDQAICFHYGGGDTVFTSDQLGVLGNTLFRNFNLYIDYVNERLIVEKGDKFNHTWPVDHSGLGLGWSYDREVEVLAVSPDTPADKAGFQKGDLIRSINGIDAGLLDGIIAIRDLLKGEPGTRYQFVVDRGGKEKKLKLKLAELL